MTPTDLKKLAEQATPGPWEASENYLIGGWWLQTPEQKVKEHCLADFMNEADARFVAACTPGRVGEMADRVSAACVMLTAIGTIQWNAADKVGMIATLEAIQNKAREMAVELEKELP